MLKSEMQHQYWITKKAVQQKLGAKEDKCITSSDAELDARIEVFKSIAETSSDLSKIIDLYQERICIVSQEECVFGRFLREAGKRSKTTGTNITNTGKAMSYCGQQRMCVRVPLLRLQHEVDTFRCRAVRDTHATIQNMEKERTEYRAALSWMKSASAELDPDNGKTLENFRTAQTHVRAAKQSFDSISMDSIQKIDLLAAARCNMFSHALVSYMSEMRQFAEKCANTFDAISKSLLQKQKYDFCVLKELTQNEGNPNESIKKIEMVDKDQALFFTDEYDDEKEPTTEKPIQSEATANVTDELESILIALPQSENNSPKDNESYDFASEIARYLSSQDTEETSSCNGTTLKAKAQAKATEQTSSKPGNDKANKMKSTATNSWLDLFADLDPLAKPEAFDLRLNAGRINYQQT